MAILSDEKSTPAWLFDKLHDGFRFTLDVCASEENRKCEKFFSQADDGLKQSWEGHTCWMNPPYSRGELAQWLTKASEQKTLGVTTLALVMGDTSCEWYHNAVPSVTAFCFMKGRVSFNGIKAGARFPSHLLLFMPESECPTNTKCGYFWDLERFISIYGKC